MSGSGTGDEDRTAVQPSIDDEPTDPRLGSTLGLDDDGPRTQVLTPAMASSSPTGSFASAPGPRVGRGDVFAGRYRLGQQLAQRGGTLTWRAFDQKLSRSVLVHVLDSEDPRTPDVLEASRKAAFATDSRFLRVLDAVVGEEPGQPSLVVCEFAPGESLEKLLRQGPLSALEAAWVARELADAMASMHSEGLFHQRINPDTVVITATGNVKIVGFLIEAAMYPDAGEGTLAWSEREQADVRAIGKVLYASLVDRWPASPGPDGRPTATWGMEPAPVDGHGWMTPRQLRSGVSPALDVICDQVLSEAPRHNEMPLRTASQLALALGKVLGTADAAADLERRMRYPLTQVRTSSRRVPADRPDDRQGAAGGSSRGSQQVPGGPVATPQSPTILGADDPLASTSRMAAVDDTPTRVAAPLAGLDDGARQGRRPEGRQGREQVAQPSPEKGRYGPRTPSEPPQPDVAASAVGRGGGSRGEDDRSTRGPIRGRSPHTGSQESTRMYRAGRPHPRRWLAVLVGLVLLALVAGLVRVALHRSGGSSGGSGSSTTWTITSARDFDPSSDGGNGQENTSEAALAIDGKDDTAWQTVIYRGSAKLGGLKPGVGLVLDLGQQRSVADVHLLLQGSPTGVELRVPNDTSTSSAPMASRSQWKVVASNASAGTQVDLRPGSAVTTRFVLVYLTSLPSIGNDRYRGGVDEVRVSS